MSAPAIRVWSALAIAIAIAIVASAGCGGGDDAPPPPDAETPVTITELRFVDDPVPPALPGDSVPVIASLRGVAETHHAYAFTATAGTVVPTAGDITLDASGDGELFATYRPDTPGTMSIELRVTDAVRAIDIEVLELKFHGLETGTGSVTAAVNQYVGSKITVPEPSVLRGVGLHTLGDANAQLGVYLDNAGVPSTRIAWVQGAILTAGRNVIGVDQALAAGDYWLIGTFGQSVDIAAGPGAGPRTATATSNGSALPLNLTNVTFSVTSTNQLAYFFVVVPE